MRAKRGRRAAERAGFTLIELLVVVTLILALTSIVAPTFRMSPTRQVENMAHLIVAHLEMARAEALGGRRLIRIDFDASAGTYTAYLDHDDDGSIGAVAAEISAFPEFGTRELEDLIVFGVGSVSTPAPGDPGSDEITFTSDRFSIDNQGIPTPWGTMGTIYITHQRDAQAVSAITVASSGSFKAWRWWPDPGEWR